jgi:hypothetical protein
VIEAATNEVLATIPIAEPRFGAELAYAFGEERGE